MMKRLTLMLVVTGAMLNANYAAAQDAPASDTVAAPPHAAAAGSGKESNDAIVRMRAQTRAANRVYNRRVAAARKIFNEKVAEARAERNKAIAAARSGVGGE